MTALKEEESFPRGRSSSSKPALRKVKDKLFKKYKKPKKKSFKNSFFEENQIKGKFKKSAAKGKDDLQPSHVIRPLTYQSLEDGMVVVGRIREIHPYHLFICLPGKLSAKVPITAVSEPYSNSLARLQKLEITQKECPPLDVLFSEGQAVVCSIVEVKKDGNVLAVNASLDPALVNKERSHHVIRAGHTLVAAVQSVEDHGYTLYTGIAGLTAFLKFGNAAKHVELKKQGRPLVVGELVRCVVAKCTTARAASRAEVTLDPRVVAETVISDGSAQTLHPGTPVSFVVQESSKAGLVVSIGRCKAYVEAAQLPSCWSSHKYIHPGEELTGTVIYNLPTTGFQITARPTYLTLKDLSEPNSPKLGIGDVIEARVTASGRKGLILCLGEKKDKDLGNKGFISIRRLGEAIPKENIAKKFPKGTVVTTKILAYDFMEEIYNCTLERAKLDQQFISVAQTKVGDRVSCRVVEVDTLGLRLVLGPIRLYAFKEHSADVPYDDLKQHFSPGDIVDARVLKVNPTNRQVYVTLKETLIRSPALTSYEMAKRGECYWGTIRKLNRSNSLYVTFYNDVAGVLALKNISKTEFKEGQLVKCYVKNVNVPQRTLVLSLKKISVPKVKDPLAVGESYQLVVSNVGEDCLEVTPCDFDGVEGLIPKCHLHEPERLAEGDFIRAWFYHKKGKTHFFSPHPSIEYFLKNATNIKHRYRMTCCVVGVGPKKVSMLSGLPDIPNVSLAKQAWPEAEVPRVHELVRLFVAEYEPDRKILKLSLNKPPKQVNNTSDKGAPKKKSEKSFEVKSKKKGNKETSESEKSSEEILIDKTTSSKLSKTAESPEKVTKKTSKITEKSLNEQTKGNDSKSTPESVDENELNISKFDSDICLVEGKEKNIKSKTVAKQVVQKEGKKKRKKISEKDAEDVSKEDASDLNTSDFDSDDSSEDLAMRKKKKSKSMEDEEENSVGKAMKKRRSSESECDFKEVNKSDKKRKKKNHLCDSDAVEEQEMMEIKKSSDPLKPKPSLSETGFMWNIKPEDLSKPENNNDEDDEEGDEDSNKEKKKKKTPAERRQAAKDEEARLRQVEQTLLDSESNPQSADQFDRAVLARPDDDQLWIKYMSYHLQATEIEKARAVARRALQTINQRLEVERLNIWIALLNLENLFGTQESQKNTLDEALRTNDEFTVYTKMLNIYSQANKAQDAEQLVHTMLRKFRESLECWVACCSTLMSCGRADKARNLLQRAISALPPKQHVNLLCKFALLENQHGNGEQAQTLFEHILTTYPKRTDIWNVYVDMLVKSGKVDVARQILERATKQKLPPRKMKMLFNKWISFEEKNGNPEKVENVRKQAFAYVNNITNNLDD